MTRPVSSARAAIAPFFAMEMAREAGARASAGQSIIRLDVGQPHQGAPARAREAAARALQAGPLGYTDALGDQRLRAAIARHYRRAYDVAVDSERIVITTGASGAFVLAFLALFDTGDTVAIAAPGYPPYRHILTALGMAPLVIEGEAQTGFHLTPDLIASRREPLAGVLVASPANPTGAMIDEPALAALAGAARARGGAFISDEIYHGLVHEGRACTALAVDPDAIVINSFSKYWAMTGWRIGWLVAPPALIKPIERLAQNLFICPPAAAQAGALAALEAHEECAARSALYGRGRALLLAELPALGLAPVVRPDGAFYALIDTSAFAADSAAFCARALDAGLALTPGIDFDETRGNRWARIAYCVDQPTLETGLERLARLVRSM